MNMAGKDGGPSIWTTTGAVLYLKGTETVEKLPFVVEFKFHPFDIVTLHG
ncbi:MAG: hypothetical protein WBB24_10970 [Maribacter sp.]